MRTIDLPALTHRLTLRFREARGLILFATVMAFASGCVSFLRYDVAAYGLPLPVLTGMLYAVMIGTAATFTSVFLPALRSLVEAAAISRFGVSLAAFGIPEFGMTLIESPFLSGTLIILGALAVRRALRAWRVSGSSLPHAAA